MDGFINIVKYKQSEFDVSDGFDLEQLILLKRENNLQFDNLGDPVTKFIYFDSGLKEYNMIYLYDNESDMISQHTNYLTEHPDHTTFPDPYTVSRYGSLDDFDVKIRPITIADDLVREMRASLELGYLLFTDESAFNALDLSNKTKFDAWAVSQDVDSTWTTYPDVSITNDKDFEFFMYETRGCALNIETNSISAMTPYGVNYYEDDLKAAITTSKTATFSDDFFTAITDLSVTVDNTRF